MKIIEKAKLIIKQKGLKVLLKRSYRKLVSLIKNSFFFFKDQFYITNIFNRQNSFSLNKFLGTEIKHQEKTNPKVISNLLSHKFDLLGSGWVKLHYGMTCSGFEDYVYDPLPQPDIDPAGEWLKSRLKKQHLKSAQQIWSSIEEGYQPIDWQLDFKSGYRWSEKSWYQSINFLNKPGADIKVPWELARMQHLPLFAKESIAEDINEQQKNNLIFEFRNQVLDFIATNPQRHGVNWSCSMDVAIRASNWLIAYDIFCSQGYEFDKDFQHYFSNSIYQHGKHIFNNLEWNYGERANHYLSNICGLAFIGRYLNSVESDTWLAFSIDQLIQEVEHQFYSEGTNFEGSTAYHLLTSEMVLYTTSLITGIDDAKLSKLKDIRLNKSKKEVIKSNFNQDPNNEKNALVFSESYLSRLFHMSEFLMDIAKPDNSFPQIGDNDSGRFFKLSPIFKKFTNSEAKKNYQNLKGLNSFEENEDYFMEETLDCSYIDKLRNALFEINDNAAGSRNLESISFEGLIIKSLSSNRNLGPIKTTKEKNPVIETGEQDFNKFIGKFEGSKKLYSFLELNSQKDLTNNLTIASYPKFGLYIYKSNHLYLAIRCWPGIKPYHLGHMHLDQLSVELVIEGNYLITDPGSYVYNPSPKKRWLYRSAESHFGPINDLNIPQEFIDDPFSPLKPSPLTVSYFSKAGFLVEFFVNNKRHEFCIKVKEDKISIISSLMDAKNLSLDSNVPISEGYGVLLNN